MNEIKFNLPKSHNFKSSRIFTVADVNSNIRNEFKMLCSDFGIKQTTSWYKTFGYTDEQIKDFRV